MKDLFLSILGLLLLIAFVRFVYGLQANTSSYFLQVLLSLPPDIKTDFEVVIQSFKAFSESISGLKAVSSSGGDIFEVVKSFFSTVGAFLNIPFAFFEFIGLLLGDILKALESMFDLLFGPVVVPISA